MFNGPRANGCDYFDDVMGDNSVPDIFATPGGGLGAYDSIKTEATPQGIVVSMHCRPPGCGSGHNVTIGWDELFAVSHAPQSGWLPEGWTRSEPNQAAYPSQTICGCGQPVAPMIRPSWAKTQIEQALQNNIVSQQQLAASPIVMQLRQIMQQGGAPQPQQPAQGYPPGYGAPRFPR
jgi:hypothetical protein